MSDRSNAKPVDPRGTADDPFDRLPPYSLEAEMCLLASMMLDPEFAREAVGTTQAGAFYLTDHAIVFDAVAGLLARSKPVDLVIMRDELKRLDQLEQIGGAAYLGQIVSSVPSAAHGREYLARVVEHAGLRSLIRTCDELTRRAFARESSTGLAEAGMGELLNVVARGGADAIVTMAQAVDEYRREIASDAPRFIPTGLRALDVEIGGVRLGQTMVIGSRPSVGKTTVLKCVLRNIARRGVKCGIVSIEEQRGKIVENEASALTRIDNRILSNRAMSAAQRAQVEDALDDIAKLPIVIDDQSVNLDEVVARVTAMAVRHKCQVVGVDHVHLVGVDGDDNRVDQIRRISGALKNTFKRLNVGGIELCQLNRGGIERPTLSSLREGGALEQDGDVVVMLHSEDYLRRQRGDPARDHKLEFLLQKNKGGRCADIPFYYDPATFTVSDWEERGTAGRQTSVEEYL